MKSEVFCSLQIIEQNHALISIFHTIIYGSTYKARVKITLRYSILSSHIYRKVLVELYMIMLPIYIGNK